MHRDMNARIVASTLVTALLVTASASAADTNTNTGSADVQWFAHGGAVFGDRFGGAMTGATILARKDLFAAGATFDASGLFATRLGAAATAGLSYRDESGFGADLLGAFGVHAYSGVGRGILSDDPGASASVPYASGRLRGVYVFGKRATHFQLGLGATLERDLRTVTRSYSYTETPWLFDGPSQTQKSTQSIGFTTMGVMIDAGMTFDVL
jgi:hypothetical protein